ncbi:MAG: PKD domain-containing protein [Candidatus Lokiarchaeota archaeon]|nr:PKD domain-containing protein [Candidatus Lokiarchaeota archaeon]
MTTSILIVIILFSIFPLEYLVNYNIINSNNRENTYTSQSDYELDFVDALHSSVWGTTDNFYAMTVNDNSYAVLFEEYVSQILPYYYISQIYRFDNIRTSFERAILHIHLLEAHTFGLDVYVGPSSSSTYKVGTIRTPGDIAFEISSLLLSSPFFVKLTDGDNPGNYGPYRISRMYVELIGLGNTIPIVNAGSDQTGNEGDILYFNGGFSDPDSGDTHTFHWNFGDGNSITGTLNPSHSYLDNGIFTVTLTVTDSQGGVGTDTLRVNINNLAPVVNAGVDQEIDEGQIVYFNGDFIDPGILDTYSINWDYGDGHSSSGSLSSSHIYEENGIYIARLNVIDDDGGIGTDSLIVTVNNQNPIVIAIEDQLTYEGNELSLVLATFYNPGIYDTHTAFIDWGDGTVNEGIIKETAPDDSGTVSGTHIYFNDGIYTVLITVVDDDGGAGTDSLVITVENVPPLVDAGLDQNVDEGELVNFNGNIINLSPSEIYDIEWNFGDGDFAYGTLTPTHTYDDNGIYSVTLTITDNDGGVDSDFLSISVENVAPMVNAGENINIDEGESTDFHGSFSDPGILDTHNIEWNFGDGQFSYGVLNPSHTYFDNGLYTAILTVTDDDGGKNSDSLLVNVNNVNPSLNVIEDQSILEGNSCTFDLLSFTDAGILDTHSSIIDWGDGAIDTGIITKSDQSWIVTGTHVYGDNGIYSVLISVNDDDGGISSDTLIIEVLNVAPVASIVSVGQFEHSYLGTYILIDELINISGKGYDPGSDDLSFKWDFGDTTGLIINTYFNTEGIFPVEIVESISHNYFEPGNYIITLSVEDDDGGIGVDTISISILNPRALKLSAIKDLESIKTGNRCIDKKIEHVIKFIEKSLTDKYWVDDSHLNPKCGLLVFVYEIIAIKWMTNFPVMEIFAGVIQKLITADQLLADIAIAEAEKMEVKEYKFQCIYEFYIKKAKEHQSNALEAYNDGFLVCSASHYLMAWKYAQFAIKFANKEFSCHCKC